MSVMNEFGQGRYGSKKVLLSQKTTNTKVLGMEERENMRQKNPLFTLIIGMNRC